MVLFFESKMYENQVSDWISNQLRQTNYSIDFFKASQMLVEYLGNDLKMISNQIDKFEVIKS